MESIVMGVVLRSSRGVFGDAIQSAPSPILKRLLAMSGDMYLQVERHVWDTI